MATGAAAALAIGGSVLASRRQGRGTVQPTGFQNLPRFAQELFSGVARQGRGLSADIFAPARLATEQREALRLLGQPIDPITGQQFQERLDVFQNPFEEQVVQGAIRDIRETGAGQFSDIARRASAAGGFGGTRQALLESELQRNIQGNIGDVSGRLRAGGFESASRRALAERQAARVAETGRVSSLFDIGSLLRQQQTAEQQAPIERLRFLQSLAEGVGGVGVAGGGTTFAPAPQGGLGAGLQNVGTTLLAQRSDIRLKKNIKKVGRKKGLDIYEFDYRDGSGRYRGVMAQDVIKIKPDAVVKGSDGYYGVIYDRIGLKLEAA